MLEHELTKLAVAIRQAVMAAKNTNSLVRLPRVRARRQDFTLSYSGDFGFSIPAPQRIEDEIWDWNDQKRFEESRVQTLEEFRSLEAVLEPKGGQLEDFARTICFLSFHGLDDVELAERVGVLGRRLEDRPIPVKIRAYVGGLSIGDSPLVISDAFVLRHPTLEDITQDVELDEYGGFPFPLSMALFSVVGDFSFEVTSTGLAQREFLRIIDALRLFRVGAIAADRYKVSSKSSLPPVEMVLSAPHRYSQFAYTLSSRDVATLKKFLQDVPPLLPDPFQTGKLTTEREIANVRYVDGLFGVPSERAITSAVTALEALFLEGGQELLHRLAQRVSVFLRILGTQSDAQSTYDNVKEGYKIRSTFIHGGPVKENRRSLADSLAPVLLEYARECTLAFFQISTPKDQLLKQLDRAMIHPTGVNELQTSFQPVVHR